MTTAEKIKIIVEATINAPVEKVWNYWNALEHITKWCTATPEWHTPRAENDLKVGGKFLTRMKVKDGSFGFDFGGVYNEVKTNELIAYTMDDGRQTKITFSKVADGIKVEETFDAETVNPLEMQKGGWQAILDNFKKYTEAN